MAHRIHKRHPERTTLKTRRHEIEQCLSDLDLSHGRSRILHRLHETDHEPTYSRKLCTVLTRLGPVFSAFGLYMSSRVDLLPVHDRLELAAIPDWAQATPLSALQALIEREIGHSPEEVFAVFESEPFESRLMFQSHRALLSNGEAVTVKLVHPEVQEQLDRDLELLPMLRHLFTAKGQPDVLIDDAIADFRRTLRRQTDLLHEAKDLEALDQDAQEFEMLKAPMVYQALCSPMVLILERIAGMTFKEIHDSFPLSRLGQDTGPVAMPGGPGALHDLAQRLCLVWLRQALLGQRFPVELRLENIVLLPNKQIAFTSSVFASLPADAKKHLWQYLIASSTEEPDKACSYLLREIVPNGSRFNEDELRYRFREIVPFRDSRWSSRGNNNSLADYLFTHWKLISERSLRPQLHLLCFYRGLFHTMDSTQQLAVSDDPLLQGLQDVRTIVMLTQFQEIMELDHVSNNLDKYAAIMMQMPQKVDAALTFGAESSARLKLQGTGIAGHRRQNNSSAVVIALLLVLAAVVLVSHHLMVSAVTGVWGERISAIVFVLLGALLLRTASRA